MKPSIIQDEPSRKSGRLGRPRSLATQEAVLKASLELTQEIGYSKLTMEGLAAKAGVGKQTIYRWWPSKAAIVLEAFTQDASSTVAVKLTGNCQADLATFLSAVFRRMNGPSGLIFRSLLSEALINPEFSAELYQRYLTSRVEALTTILQQQTTSPIPTDTLTQTIEMIYGAIWYRLIARKPLTPAVANRLAKGAMGLVDC